MEKWQLEVINSRFHLAALVQPLIARVNMIERLKGQPKGKACGNKKMNKNKLGFDFVGL